LRYGSCNDLVVAEIMAGLFLWSSAQILRQGLREYRTGESMTANGNMSVAGEEGMGLYARYVLPRLTHLAMGQAQLRPYRQRAIAGARGRVLEIGIGSGRNLPLYDDAVVEVIGIDPSREMLALAQPTVAALSRRVTLLPLSAESLPFENGSMDTVVVT